MSFEGVLNILNELTPGTTVGICGHTRPDGDAIGSTLALASVLSLAGVDVHPLLSDEETGPETYAWLSHFGEYQTPSQSPAQLDYLFVLDTPTIKRLNKGSSYLAKAQSIVLIDHHARQDMPASECLVDTSASATSQLVWQLIKASRFEVIPACAESCFVGLVTDTGSFQHSNTTPQALCDAADMVQAGADPSKIANNVFNSKTQAALELEGRVLERLTLVEDNTIGYSYVVESDFEETGALHSEGENLVELVRSVAGIKVAILFTRGVFDTRISLRAKTNVDVSAVAKLFGGGGHRAASGCTWPEKNTAFEEVISSVVQAAAQQINETSEHE